MSVKSIPLDPMIHKALNDCGYIDYTPIQSKAIPAILEGKDVAASAPTGSGKTAAFVLPALDYLSKQKPIKKPRVLILTPTRELATQIDKAATQYGKYLNFHIISILGGMSYHHQIRDLQRGADVIVATPGRLLDHLENKRVDLSHVEILVLDEADRMLDMGFIEDVDAICDATPKSRQTLLFSATLDKSILKVVHRLMNDPEHIDMSQQKLSAPNIKQSLYKAKNMQHKTQMLKRFLNDENIFKAIIFSATKQHADRLANDLRGQGFAAGALHGDLRQNVRNRTIDAFRRGKIQFLVATDVAARGLDISDITHVINYDLPRFNEDYVHRIGRTGRAGKSGEAISFFTSAELKHVQRIERFIGKRLTVQHDTFSGEEPVGNQRSDAEQFSPEAMLEDERRSQRSGGRSFDRGGRKHHDKPRRSFDRDGQKAERSFGDKPRKRFDRDEQPRKSFNRDEQPRKRFDRDEQPRKRFDRDEQPRRSFNRDEQPRKRFDRDEQPRKRFDRDEQPRKRFDRDESRERDGNRFERDKPSRRFNRDEPRETNRFDRGDKPARKRFDRDEPRGDSRNRFDRDKPRKRFDRDDKKPAGRSSSSKRSDSVFEKPVYQFEQSPDNPRVKYKKKIESTRGGDKAKGRGEPRERTSGKFTKKPFKKRDK